MKKSPSSHKTLSVTDIIKSNKKNHVNIILRTTILWPVLSPSMCEDTSAGTRRFTAYTVTATPKSFPFPSFILHYQLPNWFPRFYIPSQRLHIFRFAPPRAGVFQPTPVGESPTAVSLWFPVRFRVLLPFSTRNSRSVFIQFNCVIVRSYFVEIRERQI